jgi:hypothetical protein
MKEKESTGVADVIYGGKPRGAYKKLTNGGNKHTMASFWSSRRVRASSCSLVHVRSPVAGADIWIPD